MQTSKINKKISVVLFALFLVFSFFGTSFAAPQPTLTLTANPTTVTPTNSSSTVTWSSTNTTTCTSNAGNHPVGPSGSFNTGPLLDTTTYTMVCTGPGGSVTKSITIIMDLGLGGSSGSGTPPIDTSNPSPTPPPSNNQIDSFLDSQNSQTTTDGTYKWLEKLPGFDDSFDPTKKCSFVDYLNIMIKLLIGIGAVLAMVMIVMGGMEYMTNELISSKEEGISRIKNAMLGLVIALSSYLILNTLNPDLLNLCLDNLPTAEISIIEGDDLATSFTPMSQSSLQSIGVSCPGSGGAAALPSIANSFVGKVSYSQAKRGTIEGGTAYLDCSSFVKQVYQCAGLSVPGYSTNTMFTPSGSENVNTIQNNQANGVDIEVGNLLGWKKGESSKYPGAGHVVMYIGNGQFIEVSGSGGSNGAVKKHSLSHYANQYKHIIRLP